MLRHIFISMVLLLLFSDQGFSQRWGYTDNFKMACYLIRVKDLEARVSEGNNINLSWETSDTAQTEKYLVYRGSNPGFEINEASLLAETTTTLYLDKELEPYKHYFYKVVPVHSSGEVFFESSEVRGETFLPGKIACGEDHS